VALHLGEVKDGALACPYHGWRYGGDGRCVHIPSLVAGQDIAKGVGVRGFACGLGRWLCLVWMGQHAPAGPPARDRRFRAVHWLQGSLTLNCQALAVIENNIDWCHPGVRPPLHPRQFSSTRRWAFRDQATRDAAAPSVA